MGVCFSNSSDFLRFKAKDDVFYPPTKISLNWFVWICILDEKTCDYCKEFHKKICSVNDVLLHHPKCRCLSVPLQAAEAGATTKDGENGADWWLKNNGKLPDYYISVEDIEDLGWDNGDSPVKFAPKKMIFGGTYHNFNGRLPQIEGRIWYEADINYYLGKRNRHRIVWSNDGLIFVTYDHYETFIEIT
ncbi:MAG: phage head morphogenesis protein [Clostridia bacterium]|nr:phage head morphogenesis protein [Clostridia bacterium]